MKILLLLALKTLFFVEEPSYNFGGRYTKEGTVLLTIGVQDGSYWVTFANADSTCKLSAKASVKKGILYSQIRQGEKPVTLRISAADHTNTMVVGGLRKNDRSELTNGCINGRSIAGKYTRLFEQ